MSSTNFGSILIFASCVVGICNVLFVLRYSRCFLLCPALRKVMPNKHKTCTRLQTARARHFLPSSKDSYNNTLAGMSNHGSRETKQTRIFYRLFRRRKGCRRGCFWVNIDGEREEERKVFCTSVARSFLHFCLLLICGACFSSFSYEEKGYC